MEIGEEAKRKGKETLPRQRERKERMRKGNKLTLLVNLTQLPFLDFVPTTIGHDITYCIPINLANLIIHSMILYYHSTHTFT